MDKSDDLFIGRKDGLNKFYSLRSLREQKNALYIEGEGGLGKTRLLRKYVESCKAQRRPWHVAPDGIPEIIDFYYLENRTIGGLRKSIATRVGTEHFPRFLEIAAVLENKAKDAQALSEMQLASLHREIDFVFFEELKQALPNIRRYVVLFFDTFEVVYNRSVGRWFLEEFLTHEAVSGYLVIFAGRKRDFALPINVEKHLLGVFNDVDIQEYFQYKKDVLTLEKSEDVAIDISDGRPLILDLAVHYITVLKGNVGDLNNLSEEEIERKLVARFLDARDPIHDVIQEMTFLKQRYNSKILGHLHPDNPGYNFEKIKNALVALPFVKYRKGDKPDQDIFTLHDKFQEMIATHGGNDWKELCSDLYGKVVNGWYEKEIRESEAGPYKDLLRAEQLTYILDNKEERQKGLQSFHDYFDKIRAAGQFDFNDMLWGEVAEHIEKDKDSFGLMLDQANWLFNNARYSVAAFWLEKILDPKIRLQMEQDPVLTAGARLGHCFLRLGQVEKADQIFSYYRNEANHRKHLDEQAWFSYNLGHVRIRQGRWEDALVLYEQAINFARQIPDWELLGQIYFNAARLRARQGQTEVARKEVNRGLPLVEKNPVLHAQLLTYAGDVCRYVDDLVSAENYYNYALSLLEDREGLHEWSALALSGLGATFTRRGILTREQRSNYAIDLENQKSAFQLFLESLKIVREYKLETTISRVLDRIADVYVELNHITLAAGQKIVDQLNEMDFSIDLIEEKEWKKSIQQPDVEFQQLDFLGKAQRLYEIAFLEADRHNEPHSMFDALMQAASVSQQRERFDDLEYYATLAGTLRGLDDPQQEKIFFGFLNVLNANVIFRGHTDVAIEQYEEAFLDLVSGGRFGEYLAKKQFPLLMSSLKDQPQDVVRKYCSSLGLAWKDSVLLTDFIQNLEDQLNSSQN